MGKRKRSDVRRCRLIRGHSGERSWTASPPVAERRLADVRHRGDQVILIGEVLVCNGDRSGSPLAFHAGRYRAIGWASRRRV